MLIEHIDILKYCILNDTLTFTIMFDNSILCSIPPLETSKEKEKNNWEIYINLLKYRDPQLAIQHLQSNNTWFKLISLGIITNKPLLIEWD